jgi:VanZ family protein
MFMKYILLFIKKTLRLVLRPLSFVPALLVMYMIFQLSAQNGITSSQLSYKVSFKIVTVADKVLDKDFSEAQIEHYTDRIHHYVRKLGHVTEYFILAVTVAFPLYVYGVRGFPLMIVAGIFCVGFAAFDEYHQSFVAGRGPSPRDVAIDSIGIFIGIILVRIVGWAGRKTIFRPLSNHK